MRGDQPLSKPMKTVELKIPPPVVALVAAAAAWVASRSAPPLEQPRNIAILAAGSFALAGAAIALAGVIAFKRANTTVHPGKPQETSALVTSGVYRFSRNPMYVGLLLILVGWAAFLSSAWSLVGPFAFVLYIARFQIRPEERALAAKFGEAYAAYKAKVRRWL
ncbi:MAG TPA: isoprenylcysteine carboxylmethyltransferase family protein [Burkholderiales bacterium]